MKFDLSIVEKGVLSNIICNENFASPYDDNKWSRYISESPAR